MSKGNLIDAKSEETSMLLDKIDKIAEVQNLLLDRLNIHNGCEGLAPVSLQEASPCANCSRFDHIKLDCLIMAIKGQAMYRQGLSGGLSHQGRPSYLSSYLKYYNNPIFNNNPSQHIGFRRNNNETYPPTDNTGQEQLQEPYTNPRQSV